MESAIFHVTTWREGELYVAQCLEVDVASQGSTRQGALLNLKEAVELYFEDESAGIDIPLIQNLEVADIPISRKYAPLFRS